MKRIRLLKENEIDTVLFSVFEIFELNLTLIFHGYSSSLTFILETQKLELISLKKQMEVTMGVERRKRKKESD